MTRRDRHLTVVDDQPQPAEEDAWLDYIPATRAECLAWARRQLARLDRIDDIDALVELEHGPCDDCERNAIRWIYGRRWICRTCIRQRRRVAQKVAA